jgi:hypothetical protein
MSKKEDLINALEQKFTVNDTVDGIAITYRSMRYILKNSLIDSSNIEDLAKRVERDFEGYHLTEMKDDDEET